MTTIHRPAIFAALWNYLLGKFPNPKEALSWEIWKGEYRKIHKFQFITHVACIKTIWKWRRLKLVKIDFYSSIFASHAQLSPSRRFRYFWKLLICSNYNFKHNQLITIPIFVDSLLRQKYWFFILKMLEHLPFALFIYGGGKSAIGWTYIND